MANLDWSACPAVESVADRRSGAWVFRNTRMPLAKVFENLEVGASIDETIEQYDVTREQIRAVLEFAARSLDAPPASVGPSGTNLEEAQSRTHKKYGQTFQDLSKQRHPEAMDGE